MMTDLTELKSFLGCETPDAWVQSALENQELMLIDHAHCEKKAAATALNLMFRYVDNVELLNKMSRIAREELRHFEQVLAIMGKRGINHAYMSSSRYAGGLRKHVTNHEPNRLIDILVIGAFVEARSCERFEKIAPHLDDELAKFYLSLLKSEARHYQDYIGLAEGVISEAGVSSAPNLIERIEFFREVENALVSDEDSEFRFHSGVLVTR